MNLVVENGEVSYRPTLKRETLCKYFIEKKCSATKLENCRGCKFCDPCSQYKNKILKDKLLKTIKEKDEIEKTSGSRFEHLKELELKCGELSIKCADLERKLEEKK